MNSTENSEKAIRAFKSGAWATESSATFYAKSVNESKGLDRIYLDAQIQLICEVVPPGASILDVGAGTGALSLRLAELGFRVTAVDISASMLQQLVRRDKTGSITTVVADLFEMGEEVGLFEAAVSRWVLPHFRDWPILLERVSARLSKGGKFVFDFPNGEHVAHVGQIGKETPEKIGYDHWSGDETSPYSFYAAATWEEMKGSLSRSGMELDARYPTGMLKANSLLGKSPLLSGSLQERLIGRVFFRTKFFTELVREIESNITVGLDPRLCHGSLVVATKT